MHGASQLCDSSKNVFQHCVLQKTASVAHVDNNFAVLGGWIFWHFYMFCLLFIVFFYFINYLLSFCRCVSYSKICFSFPALSYACLLIAIVLCMCLICMSSLSNVLINCYLFLNIKALQISCLPCCIIRIMPDSK